MKLKHFEDYAIAFDDNNFALLFMIIISVYTLSYAETLFDGPVTLIGSTYDYRPVISSIWVTRSRA